MRKNGDLLRLQKISHNTCLMSRCVIVQKANVLKSSFGTTLLVVFLQFSWYHVFVELSCHCSALWDCRLHSRTIGCEKNRVQNLLNSAQSFGDTWTSSIFRGPNSVGNFPFRLVIMNPRLIASDDNLKKWLFAVISGRFLRSFFAISTRLFFWASVKKMGYPSCINLSNF